MNRPTALFSVCASALLAFASTLAAAIPQLTLKPVCLSQLQAPTTITHAGDGSGRLFICEQRGRIRIFQNGMLLPVPFLNLSAKLVPEMAAFDERGLIGLAFHPGYANAASPGHRRFYVFYSAPPSAGSNCKTTIAEYMVTAADPNLADPASERILFAFDKPQFNHNGGQIEFGPDGLLYIATGDGGSSNDNNTGHTGGGSTRPTDALGNSQDRTVLLGKILRIDPLGTDGPGGQYGIPASNPFAAAGGLVRGEIYAYGLRNPWRFSFDTGPGGTNRLFCADVGQGRIEEVNIIVSGGNYGWRYLEGAELPTFSSGALPPAIPMAHPGGTLIAPIAVYAHPGVTSGTPALPQFGISITGGFVYRGSAIPALQGKYIFADYSNNGSQPRGIMLGIEETTPDVWTSVSALSLTNGNPLTTRIYAMGRDEQGELYVGTNVTQGPSQNDPISGLPTGGIYKIVAPVSVTTNLEPAKDNTMFSAATGNSNGRGFLFAGRSTTNPDLHRALLAFNLTGALPAGALLTAADVSLTMDKTTTDAADFALHCVTEEWGEAGSDAGDPGGKGAPAQPGDATWSHRLFDTQAWSAPGGAFAAAPSATTSVAFTGTYTWSGNGLLADVQNWLTTPAQNFGWVLIGDESVGSAKRFQSRESADDAVRPKLSLTYLGAPPTRREAWLQQYFLVGQFVDDQADLDGDTLGNQLEYAFAFSPLAPEPAGAAAAVAITAGPGAGGTVFTINFRRDPRATDLTYRLQTSSDLVNWGTIVQSVAGAEPTGMGFVSESDIAGAAPVKLVTARETVPNNDARRFARVQVLRQP